MNGIIIVDKPEGWTSHDVVAKLRGVLKEKRIGHGGTLDPMATGVLPVFIGRATRAAQFCENAEKEYIAGLRLGVVTDTQDITGSVIAVCETAAGRDALLSVLPDFTGLQKQIPPMYSAVKIGGKKLYEIARRGGNIERPAREINIRELELLRESEGDYLLRVVCSKGTYIRTLCHDIGQKLGCGGTLCSLRRTRAGAFCEEDAIPLTEIIKNADSGAREAFIKPVDSIFAELPRAVLSGADIKSCKNGAGIKNSGLSDGKYRVYADDGEFLMLGEVRSGILKSVKSFFEVMSCEQPRFLLY